MFYSSLLQTAPTIIITLVIFILIIVFYLFGYQLRKRNIKKNPDQLNIELGAISGTLLGLLGLLLAFTFGMANTRYDTRRQVVIEEANDISTVILRTELLADSVGKILRQDLKEYVEARIGYYEANMDLKKIVEHYYKADSISNRIWKVVASYAKKDNSIVRTSEIVPALNAMIDITTTRRAAGEATIPFSIMCFLFILCCCSAFLLGYDNKKKIDWIVVFGFAIMLSATVFSIIDLDRPRSGLITLDGPNEKIVELRKMFNK